ncbi:uncharacterized protein N7484_000932 [Penicillium longicatenatum]|uniref:uncharacterized protein n=1 Tax=Penicillium longicatenatum TaxID=1561947 RepID=UPI002548DFCF|nr:uncharacterized protein N7484_000932 [Penicillium longicatenatum]KAJ5657283.1 hypothetical protein N7484_000932 [Penicillium longicatenatum]
MDTESIADSNSRASAQSVHEQQQQLTDDLLNQVPHGILGQTGTSDWLDSVIPHSNPEDRLGLILGDRLELTSILSVGDKSATYTAVDIHTNISYCVKALNKVRQDSRQLKSQQQEIRLHHLAGQHPNVISLVRIIDSVDDTYIVMELCPEGDLFCSITEKGNFVGNGPLVKRAFLQILDAVQFCHSQGIYHRNLKPESILVKDEGMTLMLASFSLATTDHFTSDFGCGSPFYMSPDSCYASAPNDVWSLGVILVNLTCGRNPWKRASTEDSTFRAYLKDPFFLRTILPISNEVVTILSRIFECDPEKRITVQELRQLILECPHFTTSSVDPWVVGSEHYSRPQSPVEPLDTLNLSSGDSAWNEFAKQSNETRSISPLRSIAEAEGI